MMDENLKFTILTSLETIFWFLIKRVSRTCITCSICHHHILSTVMGLHAVSAANAVYALRQSFITEPCQLMLCSTKQSKPLDIVFSNALENSTISEQGEACMTPG
jgi:hypothetical protein